MRHAFLLAAGLALLGADAAGAACRVTGDGADGAGGYRGRVGDRRIRVQGNDARTIANDNAVATQGRGARGAGGVRDNTQRGGSCISGGLRVTDC